MDRLISVKTAKITALLLTFSFLAVHIFLFALFAYFHVTPMKYFNVFSICFYLVLAGIVAWKGMFANFATLVYLEVLAHMSAAVFFTG